MSYVFKKIPNNTMTLSHDPMTVTVEVDDGVVITDLLEAFKGFLLACGYADYGDLEFVGKDEEEIAEE